MIQFVKYSKRKKKTNTYEIANMMVYIFCFASECEYLFVNRYIFIEIIYNCICK